MELGLRGKRALITGASKGIGYAVAEVFADVGLAERLWRTADKTYFSDYTDPRLRVIRVTPARAEYWEGSGLLATVVSLLSAGAKGERPKLGENEKVAM